MTGRVIVVGSLNLDTVLRLPHLPRPGETVAAPTKVVLPGGKGGNQAVAAARAGAEVLMLGAVGPDGGRYLAHLKASGVETTHIDTVPDTPTGSAVVLTDAAGDNIVVVSEGANAHVQPALDDLGLSNDDVVSLQFELPHHTVFSAAKQAKEAGATVLVNPSPWRPADDILALADVIVVNELEAAELGDTVPASRRCTTLGARGARWGELSVAATRLEPVDTTGAGDSFTGTLAALLATGHAKETALRRAVAAAGGVCGKSGAQQWRSV
ncbi:ribokinase [Amycolatopsis jejuensis]|uniref:ribokinase n=1 Tax=Amycolatopsis jejuensis TaxID=330084 RepID=UPI0005255379|nr:ribokinase [Amycolatopsis jejuensis]